MRALIIGAGATGRVYGAGLAAGGADVSVFVRAKYAAEARRGYDLFEIASRNRRLPRRFEPREVLTSRNEVAARRFDQVWLCVATNALDDPALLSLLERTGQATVVSLQPGFFAMERLSKVVERSRLVCGVIGIIGYEAPLAHSEAAYERATGAGTAYFFPPGSPSTFSGLEHRVQPVVDALHMGKTPARRIDDAQTSVAFSSSILMPVVAALEMAGWSLERFRSDPASELAARAAQEALEVTAAETGSPAPIFAPLLRPFVLRLALGVIGPRLAPFDLEAFLRVHFEKVGVQSRMLLEAFVREGEARGLETTALRELLDQLGPTP